MAALWVLSLSLVVSARSDKAADEWERSGSRFSFLWGGITGGALVALLLALPPFHTLIAHLAAWSQGLDVTEIDRTTVIVVFAAGFGAVLLAQTLCSLVFLLIWRRRTLSASE